MSILLEHLPVQDEFYRCTDSPIAFIGGLATGKTMVAADKILTSLARYPKAPHYIFSNTYDQLKSGTLHTFFERINDVWLPAYPQFQYIDRVRYDKTIVFPRLNALIRVRSVDQDINFKSLEIAVAWLDETQYWNKESYDRVIGRLRGTTLQRQCYPDMPLQIFITANPPHSHSHFLYEETHEPNPVTGRIPIKLFTATTYDNPFLPDKYIQTMEESYDPDIARAELMGEFLDLGRGQVFRRFNRQKHCIDDKEAMKRGLPRLKYDQQLPLCWSHDFNLDPLCSVLFQWRRINAPGYQKTVMFIYDCIRIESALISDAPKELLNRKEAASIAMRNEIILYGDAAGNQQSRQTGVSDWAALRTEMARLGFKGASRINPGNPLHIDSSADANRQLEDSQGNLGVVIAKNKNTIWLALDLEKMMWKPGTTIFDIAKPKPGEVIPNSKKLTHLGDAMRYPISYEASIEERFRFNMTTSR
jgi:hypothetical protein